MSLIDLYINDSGTIRRIGDNCHDQLTIDEDGRLHYYNLQNGDGCTLGEEREHDECFYEFVSNVDEYGYNCDPRQADTPQNERSEFVKVSDRECPWCKAVCASTDKYCHECGWHIADAPQTEAVVKPYKPTNREILDAIENSDCPWK
jgi:hypothetical protein